MKKVLSWGILILILVLLGFYLGTRHYAKVAPTLHRVGILPTTQQLFYCPPIEHVLSHLTQAKPWHDKALTWKMVNHEAKPSKVVTFMQAILNREDNRLACYYHWPTPKKQNHWSTLTIQLSPNANTLILPAGRHWRKTQYEFMCRSSLPLTCAFRLFGEDS